MRLRVPISLLALLLLAGWTAAGQGEAAQEKKELRRKAPKRERRVEQPRVESVPERPDPLRPRPTAQEPRRELPDRPTTKPAPEPVAPPTNEAPAPELILPDFVDFGPVVQPAPVVEPVFVPISSPAGICELTLEDEFLAWRLADVTEIPFWEVAAARLEGWSWPTVLRELKIEVGEMELALQLRDDEALDFAWEDEEIRSRVLDRIGHHELPEVSCEDGFWQSPVVTRDFYRFDPNDREIAARIAGQTGFSKDKLLQALREFQHWSEVARVFSLSPYLFEVSFDVQLPGVWRGEILYLDYPSDRVLHESVGEPGAAMQPVSWTPESGEGDGALKTGLKWAAFLGIVSLIGGITG